MSALRKVCFYRNAKTLIMKIICKTNNTKSSEAIGRVGRIVLFERSEFTILDFFGSFCIKAKTNIKLISNLLLITENMTFWSRLNYQC